MRKLEAVDHVTDRGGLWSAEPVVLQIEVVDDRGNPCDGRFLDHEDTAQRFECAAFPLVAEVDAEHIERNGIVRNGIPIRGEFETRLRIDEPANQPCRCHAIDSWARSGDPQPPAIVFAIGRSGCLCHRGAFDLARRVLIEPLQECGDPVPAGAPEKIDVLDRGQPFSKDFQEAADGGCARAARPSSARRAFQDLLDVTSQYRVSLLPRAPKSFNQPVIRPGVDVVGRKHAHVSSSRLDLGLQPFEVFASTWRVWQRIHRLLDRDGSELLQAAPRTYTQIRWT